MSIRKEHQIKATRWAHVTTTHDPFGNRLGAIALALAALLASATASRAEGPQLPRLSGMLEGDGILRLDRNSPRQRPRARLDLQISDRIGAGLRYQISTIGLWGGTLENSGGGGFVDFGHAVQTPDPSLELDEAYLETLGDLLDLRIGKQKFSWGRLDGIQPNDLLNSRRFLDPLRTDETDSKVGAFAASLAYYFPPSLRPHLPSESRVSLVWAPFHVPWRFPSLQERWFPPIARASDGLTTGNISIAGCGANCPIRISQQIKSGPPPARQIDNGNFGARLSGRSQGVDWAVVYYNGFDVTPAFELEIMPGDPLIASDSSGNRPAPAVAIDTTLIPAYPRFQSLGADGATTLGGLTVRFEGAFRFRRPYVRNVSKIAEDIVNECSRQLPGLCTEVSELLQGRPLRRDSFFQRDAIEWGIGADYLIDGWLPLIELYQVIVLRNSQDLLLQDVDTRLTMSLRRKWLDDRLETQLTALWGIESRYAMVRPQVTLALNDQVQIRLGALGIWGNSESLIGQYNRNSELFARVRYSF